MLSEHQNEQKIDLNRKEPEHPFDDLLLTEDLDLIFTEDLRVVVKGGDII